MKITALETIRLGEFGNLLWLRLHTDEGLWSGWARRSWARALWDLFGKAAGRPVFEVLGGRTRNSIRTYNTCAGYK